MHSIDRTMDDIHNLHHNRETARQATIQSPINPFVIIVRRSRRLAKRMQISKENASSNIRHVHGRPSRPQRIIPAAYLAGLTIGFPIRLTIRLASVQHAAPALRSCGEIAHGEQFGVVSGTSNKKGRLSYRPIHIALAAYQLLPANASRRSRAVAAEPG